MFNWADEFLGEENETMATVAVAMDTSNLATTPITSNLLLTTQYYAVQSPVAGASAATSLFPTGSMVGQTKPGMVVVGGQQIINTAQTG